MIDDIFLFIILYEAHSFTKVAETSNIQQSTVSKRIYKLEAALGHALIIRNGTNFKVTEFGDYIYNKFRHIPLFISTTLESYKNGFYSDSNDTITVSLPFILSYELLSPHIEKFMIFYPNVKLNILYEKDVPDFGVVDFAITRHNINHLGFTTKFFRREYAHLYCSNQYAQKYGVPLSTHDLNDRKFINLILDGEKHILPLKNGKTSQEFIPHFCNNLHIDNVMHSKQMGIHATEHLFGCWDFMCAKELAAGVVVPILPDWSIHTLDFYLIQKFNARNIDKIFINFISEHLGCHLMNGR
ncbi:MAG: LysR family transcriptional regulator [Burkholderiales bacterium]|nr:LysR family transcriptional regulator [Burkholderiales bacterium]